MKNCRILPMLCALCCSVSLAETGSEPSSKSDKVREFAAEFTRWLNPYSDFSSDEWEVQAFYTDIDGDGVDDVIATSRDQTFADGSSWFVMNGRFLGSEKKLRERGHWRVYCKESQFYLLENAGARPRLVIRKCGVGSGEKFARHDVFLDFENGMSCVKEIPGGICGAVAARDFKSLRRVYPIVYRGFGLERKSYWLAPMAALKTREKQDVDAALCACKDAFVKVRGIGESVPVRIVPADVDGDGDMDCFVAAEAGEVDSERLNWQLYVKSGGGYVASTNNLDYGAVQRIYAKELPSKIHCSKESFLKVEAHKSDPVVIVMDDGSKLSRIANCVDDPLLYSIERLDSHLVVDQGVGKNEK